MAFGVTPRVARLVQRTRLDIADRNLLTQGLTFPLT